ncbi:hypothetical protein POVCU1_045240 [Plasmodium ovale curtisi]|uniref:Uncharacterized protein n=1 Tax=Plasmodium ovale curtisi TaxID=864141 RepID=A0A1A8X3I7_PLAOA|nr:hypothetical protein POVCU1_045240 [Plasmodium ovale curtisi]
MERIDGMEERWKKTDGEKYGIMCNNLRQYIAAKETRTYNWKDEQYGELSNMHFCKKGDQFNFVNVWKGSSQCDM